MRCSTRSGGAIRRWLPFSRACTSPAASRRGAGSQGRRLVHPRDGLGSAASCGKPPDRWRRLDRPGHLRRGPGTQTSQLARHAAHPCTSRTCRVAAAPPGALRDRGRRTTLRRAHRSGGGSDLSALLTPVDLGTVYRTWHRAREEVLSERAFDSMLARRPYDLRHACLSTWLNAGVPRTSRERPAPSIPIPGANVFTHPSRTPASGRSKHHQPDTQEEPPIWENPRSEALVDAWQVQDSNLRRNTPTDLQSAPIGRSGNLPLLTRVGARRSDTKDYNSTTRSLNPPANQAGEETRHGRLVVRHRQQARPAGGRQRHQPGPARDLPALRLQEHRRHHRALRRAGGGDLGQRRRPRDGRPRRLQGQADQAQPVAEDHRRG